MNTADALGYARHAATASGVSMPEVLWEFDTEETVAVLLDVHKFCAAGIEGEMADDEARQGAINEAAARLREVTPEQVAELRAVHAKAKAELAKCRQTNASPQP